MRKLLNTPVRVSQPQADMVATTVILLRRCNSQLRCESHNHNSCYKLTLHDLFCINGTL
ncbi:hypothetical protein Hanom_Chr04g00354781 [Helianthus anomalus]